MFLSLLFVAISVSIDALVFGALYGIKGIKIPIVPKILICSSSLVYAGLGLVLGKGFVHILGLDIAEDIGVFALILIGAVMIIKGVFNAPDNDNLNNCEEDGAVSPIIKLGIKSIGITIMVIRNPEKGDIDNSGVVDNKEALFLGIALNMDAIAACMGIAMTGISSAWLPLLLGTIQYLFISSGLFFGRKIGNALKVNERLISVLPGIMLIVLGICRFMF